MVKALLENPEYKSQEQSLLRYKQKLSDRIYEMCYEYVQLIKHYALQR